MVVVIVDHWTGKGYQLVTRDRLEDNIQLPVYGACSEPYIRTVSYALWLAQVKHGREITIYRETGLGNVRKLQGD